MNQMKAFMKRHIAALLVLLLVLSAPVGLVWARYTSALSVTGDASLTLTVTNPKEYTIDKNKMWNALKALSTRPTAIKLCTSNSLPSSGLSAPKSIEASGSGKIGLYTSGATVYIAPVGGGDAKMYAPEDSSEMFKLDNMGYTDKSKLTVLDGLSNLDTSRVTNMNSMFYNCEAVKTLDVSGFNTSNVTDMGYMFRDCNTVTALDVSKFNTSSVTDMHAMFLSCRAVTMLDVSQFDTAKVTDMSSMFADCAVTTIDLSKFNTSKVTSMERMFENCTKLTTLDVSAFNTSNVTTMNAMFDGCKVLSSLDLSTFNTGKVRDMTSMFQWCNNLQTLNVSNFDTSLVNSFMAMFNWCENLRELDLSSFKVSKDLSFIQNMFWGCRKLQTIYVNEAFDLTKIRGSKVFEDCRKLVGGNGTTYDINKIDETYARIDKPEQEGYFTAKFTTDDYILDTNKMQKALDGLTTKPDKVTICKSGEVPTTGTLIATVEEEGSRWVGLYKDKDNNVYIAPIGGGTAPVYAQTDSTGLFDKSKTGTNPTEIDLSNLDTSRVETMDDMFKDCAKLKTIYTDDKFSTDKVTSSDGMFTGCTTLEGGEGTKYDSSKTDKTYARVDGGTANPGYFTEKNASNAADLTKTLTVDLNGLSNIDAAPVN